MQQISATDVERYEEMCKWVRGWRELQEAVGKFIEANASDYVEDGYLDVERFQKDVNERFEKDLTVRIRTVSVAGDKGRNIYHVTYGAMRFVLIMKGTRVLYFGKE